jgi:hypothetical protein
VVWASALVAAQPVNAANQTAVTARRTLRKRDPEARRA